MANAKYTGDVQVDQAVGGAYDHTYPASGIGANTDPSGQDGNKNGQDFGDSGTGGAPSSAGAQPTPGDPGGADGHGGDAL